jgi:hypothetical protein
MRRISLALALLGAVAAAGCGGAGSTNPPASQNKGLPDTTFSVTVFGEKAVSVRAHLTDSTKPFDRVTNPLVATVASDYSLTAAAPDPSSTVTVVIPDGGIVTGTGIKCGIDGTTLFGACSAQFAYQDPSSAASIALTATTNAHFYPPNSANLGAVHGWAGACTGNGACFVRVSSPQYVAIRFATDTTALGAHPPFAAPEIHGVEYGKYLAKTPGDLVCTDCHGANLQGQGIAPSCSLCHPMPGQTGGHLANFADHHVHGLAYYQAYVTKTGTSCSTSGCHTANLQFCTSCHPFSVPRDMQSPNMSYDKSGHFDPGGQFDHGGTCARCHTTGGFLDYLGVTSVTINGTQLTLPGNANYTVVPAIAPNADFAWNEPVTTTATSGAGFAYTPTNLLPSTTKTCAQTKGVAPCGDVDPLAIVSTDGSYVIGVPFKCQTCHNPVADVFTGTNLTAPGLTTVNLTSNTQITTDHATALCAQCHAAGAAGELNPAGLPASYASRGSLASSSWGVDALTSAAVPGAWAMPTDPDAVLASASTFKPGGAFPATNNTAIIPYPHGLIAASTYFGSAAATYYQYQTATYDGPNPHGACTDCHGAHTLDVNVTAQTCGRCHFKERTQVSVTSLQDLAENRQLGFQGVDIDGNGAVAGIDAEIFGPTALSCAGTCSKGGLVNKLAVAIQTYANVVAGQSISWTTSFPGHFYIYGSPAGTVTPPDEWTPVYPSTTVVPQVPANVFTNYTPALVRALYNYQAIYNDPGAWAHNPRYAIEILFDAITDLNRGIATKNLSAVIPFTGNRTFAAHFGANNVYGGTNALIPDQEAGANPAGWGGFEPNASAHLYGMKAASNTDHVQCAICHWADTKDFFTAYNAGNSLGPVNLTFTAPPVNGFACTTCHQPAAGTFGDPADPGFTGDQSFNRFYSPATVTFPLEAQSSLATTWIPTSPVATGGKPANSYLASGDIMCITCHAGRMTGASSSGASGVKNNTAGTVAIKYLLSTGNGGSPITDTTWTTTKASTVHGYGCAGTVLGSNAAQMYQYDPDPASSLTGQYFGYASFWVGFPDGNNPVFSPHGARCSGCHDWSSTGHSFIIDWQDTAAQGGTVPTGILGPILAGEKKVPANSPNTFSCAECHSGPYALTNIQTNLNNIAAALLLDIVTYSGSQGYQLCWDPTASYGSGGFAPGAVAADGVTCAVLGSSTKPSFNAKLIKATYNYSYVKGTDKFAWVHNYQYAADALIDSMVDVVGSTAAYTQLGALGLTRP